MPEARGDEQPEQEDDGVETRIPWPRVLIEGVVIVASILLAFGIDAWWDQSQRRGEEQRLLRNLHAEFQDARDTLRVSIDRHREYHSDARALVAAPPGVPTGRPLGFRRVYRTFVGLNTTHLKTGALDGALASGRLDLVTDDELRSLLASWHSTLGEFTEQETYIWELALESRRALLSSAPVAEQIIHAAADPPLPLPDDPSPRDVADFALSEIGQNYASLRAMFEALAIRDGQILLAWIDQLLVLLERDIR
jgi:hypothetical protein